MKNKIILFVVLFGCEESPRNPPQPTNVDSGNHEVMETSGDLDTGSGSSGTTGEEECIHSVIFWDVDGVSDLKASYLYPHLDGFTSSVKTDCSFDQDAWICSFACEVQIISDNCSCDPVQLKLEWTCPNNNEDVSSKTWLVHNWNDPELLRACSEIEETSSSSSSGSTSSTSGDTTEGSSSEESSSSTGE